ncbi:MAG TPA: hypothetical protein PKI62_03690 [bacterium]|nr:hypothetical protein [bacterium]HPR88594.1 hypothetical protein [bacterium]
MQCDKILREICNDLAEDIDSEVCGRLRSHLQECPDCTRQLSAMRTTIHLYHCLGEQEVPEAMHQRLAALLNLPEGTLHKGDH